MTGEEFYKYISELPLGEYIVLIYLKYKDEKTWRHSNEILTLTEDYIEWLDDWDEGEEEVYFEGCMPIDEITITHFYKEK